MGLLHFLLKICIRGLVPGFAALAGRKKNNQQDGSKEKAISHVTENLTGKSPFEDKDATKIHKLHFPISYFPLP